MNLFVEEQAPGSAIHTGPRAQRSGGLTLRCALTALLLLAAHDRAHAHEETSSHFLCEGDEQLVFGCSLDKRQVSVCASPDLTSDTGYVQYRLGRPGQLEQVYPDGHLPPRDRFFLSIASYSGGGASAIRISIDGRDHFLFDQTVRTNFVPGQPHYPEFSAGLITHEAGEGMTAVTLPCLEHDASIRKVAYDHFPREEYPLDLLP